MPEAVIDVATPFTNIVRVIGLVNKDVAYPVTTIPPVISVVLIMAAYSTGTVGDAANVTKSPKYAL